MQFTQIETLPKVQLSINRLLQNVNQKEVRFYCQEYSLQLINNDLLKITFYSPSFQYIQLSLDFKNIKSLNHCSLSISHVKHRVRLVLYREGEISYYQAPYRKAQLSQQRFTNQPMILGVDLDQGDEVGRVSEDLSKDGDKGTFFIATKKKRYYLLKANKSKINLVDLNPLPSLQKMWSKIRFHLPIASQLKQVQEMLLINSSDQQCFKVIIQNQFQIEIGLLNIFTLPTHPSTILFNPSIHLQKHLPSIFLIKSTLVIKSNIYQINHNDIVIVMLVMVDQQKYLVGAGIDLSKNRITNISYRKISQSHYQQVQWVRTPNHKHLLFVTQTSGVVYLQKLNIHTLQIIEHADIQIENYIKLTVNQSKYPISESKYPMSESKSPISESKSSINQPKRVCLISQNSIFQIKLNESRQNCAHNNLHAQQNQEQKVSKIQQQLKSSIYNNKKKILKLMKQNKNLQLIEILKRILQKVQNQINQQQNLLNKSQQICQLYLFLIFRIVIAQNQQKTKQTSQNDFGVQSVQAKLLGQQFKLKQIQHFFNDLTKLSDNFINQQQSQSNIKLSSFFNIWNESIKSIKGMALYNINKNKQAIDECLKLNFTLVINNLVQHNKLLSKPIPTLMLTLLSQTIELIPIQKQTILKYLQTNQNQQLFKQIAFKTSDIQLFAILFYQTGLIKISELQKFYLGLTNDDKRILIERMLEDWFQRVRDGKLKFHQRFLTIIKVFQHNLQHITFSNQNIALLIDLQIQPLQQLCQRILTISKSIKIPQNAYKLLLASSKNVQKQLIVCEIIEKLKMDYTSFESFIEKINKQQFINCEIDRTKWNNLKRQLQRENSQIQLELFQKKIKLIN